jgi:carbonic anhydrase
MSVWQQVEQDISAWEDWVLRRQKGIPNNRRLWVLACMDERLPVEQVLGLRLGDAHVFRNAGGLVTDDAIRSAALSVNFFGTREIIVLNHTECGMMSATPGYVVRTLREKLGVEPKNRTSRPLQRICQGTVGKRSVLRQVLALAYSFRRFVRNPASLLCPRVLL